MTPFNTASFTNDELDIMIVSCIDAKFDPWMQAALPRLRASRHGRLNMWLAHTNFSQFA
jgi:hypothetical protein